MALFRDGVIWYASLEQLVAAREHLSIGAISFQLEQGQPPLEVRAEIQFDLMVEGWRCGPILGEVVHTQGNNVGIQVGEEATQTIRQLIDQITESKTGQGYQAVSEAVESVQIPGTGTYAAASESEPPPTESAPPAVDGAAASDDLRGKLATRPSLGTLDALFDRGNVDRPGELVSCLQLFLYLNQTQASGTLFVQSKDFTKTVWFKQGTPLRVSVSPAKEDELLGQLLIKAKWLGPQHLGEGLRWAKKDGVGLGTALVRAGMIDAGKLNRVLSHQTYRRLQNMFSWSGANFHFTAEDKLPKPPYHPVAVPRLLTELAMDLLRDGTPGVLNLMLQPYNDFFPSIATTPEAYLKHLIPDAKALSAIGRVFDGSRPLRKALSASVLGRPRTVRIALALIAAKAIELHQDPINTKISPSVLIDERLRALETQDYFLRLGVGYAVHAGDLEPAHKKRLAEYAIGTDPQRVNPKACEGILRLLDEASMVLSAASTRRKYRLKLLGKRNLEVLCEMVSDQAELASLQGDAKGTRKLLEALAELRSG